MKTVHSKLRNFKCEQCNKLFSSPALVRRHIMGVHEKIKDFACITCNATFSDKWKLSEHEKNVHSQTRIKCDSCNITLIPH